MSGASEKSAAVKSAVPTPNKAVEKKADEKADNNEDPSQPLIYFVTGNAKKLAEVRAILTGWRVHGVSVDLPELQGEPEEVSLAKVRLAVAKVNGPVIVEDTSLCYNALNGLPGVYIKWFLDKVGLIGLNNLLAAYPDKTAYAQCIFSFAPNAHTAPIAFVGKCPGRIVPPRGAMPHFGWDPVFEPDGHKLTFQEMPITLKNRISHRSQSLAKLRAYLDAHPTLLASPPVPASSPPPSSLLPHVATTHSVPAVSSSTEPSGDGAHPGHKRARAAE